MSTPLKPLLAAIALVLAIAVAACGEDDTATDSTPGNGVDRAFVSEMIPHHRSAVDMAEVAQQRSQRDEIKQLAEEIISTQTAEIEQMQGLDQRLDEAGVKPGDLGMAAHEMGTDMDADMLRDAQPFDREFIDMMITHHQGAIRMARMELEQGENPELEQIAGAIVDAQAKEIDQLNEWRVDWYGGLSPSGGVPQEGDMTHER